MVDHFFDEDKLSLASNVMVVGIVLISFVSQGNKGKH